MNFNRPSPKYYPNLKIQPAPLQRNMSAAHIGVASALHSWEELPDEAKIHSLSRITSNSPKHKIIALNCSFDARNRDNAGYSVKSKTTNMADLLRDNSNYQPKINVHGDSRSRAFGNENNVTKKLSLPPLSGTPILNKGGKATSLHKLKEQRTSYEQSNEDRNANNIADSGGSSENQAIGMLNQRIINLEEMLIEERERSEGKTESQIPYEDIVRRMEEMENKLDNKNRIDENNEYVNLLLTRSEEMKEVMEEKRRIDNFQIEQVNKLLEKAEIIEQKMNDKQEINKSQEMEISNILSRLVTMEDILEEKYLTDLRQHERTTSLEVEIVSISKEVESQKLHCNLLNSRLENEFAELKTKSGKAAGYKEDNGQVKGILGTKKLEHDLLDIEGKINLVQADQRGLYVMIDNKINSKLEREFKVFMSDIQQKINQLVENKLREESDSILLELKQVLTAQTQTHTSYDVNQSPTVLERGLCTSNNKLHDGGNEGEVGTPNKYGLESKIKNIEYVVKRDEIEISSLDRRFKQEINKSNLKIGQLEERFMSMQTEIAQNIKTDVIYDIQKNRQVDKNLMQLLKGEIEKIKSELLILEKKVV